MAVSGKFELETVNTTLGGYSLAVDGVVAVDTATVTYAGASALPFSVISKTEGVYVYDGDFGVEEIKTDAPGKDVVIANRGTGTETTTLAGTIVNSAGDVTVQAGFEIVDGAKVQTSAEGSQITITGADGRTDNIQGTAETNGEVVITNTGAGGAVTLSDLDSFEYTTVKATGAGGTIGVTDTSVLTEVNLHADGDVTVKDFNNYLGGDVTSTSGNVYLTGTGFGSQGIQGVNVKAADDSVTINPISIINDNIKAGNDVIIKNNHSDVPNYAIGGTTVITAGNNVELNDVAGIGKNSFGDEVTITATKGSVIIHGSNEGIGLNDGTTPATSVSIKAGDSVTLHDTGDIAGTTTIVAGGGALTVDVNGSISGTTTMTAEKTVNVTDVGAISGTTKITSNTADVTLVGQTTGTGMSITGITDVTAQEGVTVSNAGAISGTTNITSNEGGVTLTGLGTNMTIGGNTTITAEEDVAVNNASAISGTTNITSKDASVTLAGLGEETTISGSTTITAQDNVTLNDVGAISGDTNLTAKTGGITIRGTGGGMSGLVANAATDFIEYNPGDIMNSNIKAGETIAIQNDEDVTTPYSIGDKTNMTAGDQILLSDVNAITGGSILETKNDDGTIDINFDNTTGLQTITDVAIKAGGTGSTVDIDGSGLVIGVTPGDDDNNITAGESVTIGAINSIDSTDIATTDEDGQITLTGYGHETHDATTGDMIKTGATLTNVSAKGNGQGSDIKVTGFQTIKDAEFVAGNDKGGQSTIIVQGTGIDSYTYTPVDEPVTVETRSTNDGMTASAYGPNSKVEVGNWGNITNADIDTAGESSEIHLSGILNPRPGSSDASVVSDISMTADGDKSKITIDKNVYISGGVNDITTIGDGNTIDVNSNVYLGAGTTALVDGDRGNINLQNNVTVAAGAVVKTEGVGGNINLANTVNVSGGSVIADGAGSKVNVNYGVASAGKVTIDDGGKLEAHGLGAEVNVRDNTEFDDGGILVSGGFNKVNVDGSDYNADGVGVEFNNGSVIEVKNGFSTVDIKNNVDFDDSDILTKGGNNTINIAAHEDGDVNFANGSKIDADGGNTTLTITGELEDDLQVKFDNSIADLAGGGNKVTFDDNVEFVNDSKLIVGDNEETDVGNKIAMSNNVWFDDSSVEVKGKDTVVDLSKTVDFDDSTFKVFGDGATANLKEGVTFTGTAGAPENTSVFTIDGDNGTITTGKDVVFTDATLGLSGTNGLIEITENGDFAGQSLIYISGAGDGENFNKLHIHGTATTANPYGVLIQDDTEVRVSGGKNILLVEGVTTFEDRAKVNVYNDGNSVTLKENTTVKDAVSVTVYGNENTVDVTGDTKFKDTASLTIGGHANTVTVDGNANFSSGATLNVNGDENTVAIAGRTIFEGEAATNINGSGNQNLTISGNAQYKDKAKYNLNGDSNRLVVSGNATFGPGTGGDDPNMPKDYAGITVSGYNNDIYLTEGTTFEGNSMVYSTGGQTSLYVLDQTNFKDNSQIQLLAGEGMKGVGGNTLILRLTDKQHSKGGPYLEKWDENAGKFIKTDENGNAVLDDNGDPVYGGFIAADEMYGDDKLTYNTKTTFSGSGNELVVGGNTWIRDFSSITFLKDSLTDASPYNTGENDGYGNTVTFTEYSRFTGDLFMEGGQNKLDISGKTMYQGWTQMAGEGNIVRFSMDEDLINFRAKGSRPADYYNITGQVVFEGDGYSKSGKNNVVLIENGQLTNNNGSVIGSDDYLTEVYITGGQTNLLVSGAAGSHYEVKITDQWMDSAVSTLHQYDRFTYGTGANSASDTLLYEGNIYNIRAKAEGELVRIGDDFSDYQATYLARDVVKDLNNSIHYLGTSSINPVPYVDPDTGEEVYEEVQKVYQSYAILNMSEVVLDENAVVHIGEVADGRKPDVYGMRNEPSGTTPTDYDRNLERAKIGNQLSTDELYVQGGSKIMIHEDESRIGKTLDETTYNKGDADTLEESLAYQSRNVVNYTFIEDGSEMTIDRTTIHGTIPGTAEIEVSTGGVLYGFGEWEKGDKGHDPLRANLVGNLYIDSGALLQYFDADFYSHRNGFDYTDSLRDDHIFDTYNFNVGVSQQLRGVVMKVESSNGEASGEGGWTTFAPGAVIRTRLFADANTLTADVVNNGSKSGEVKTSYSDYLMSTGSDFSAIVNPNYEGYELTGSLPNVNSANKVQYQPVFGYHSDLASKLQFDVFNCDTQETSYYFKVIDGDRTIEELVDYDDANHLFNNQILVSDMLGSWSFLKSGDNQDITLRFRLLAEHPINGGLAANVLDSNNLKIAQYLDEIRYPFQTAYTDLDFGKDPSAVQLDFHESLSGAYHPGYAGFGGNMSEWYAENSSSGSVEFDNYTAGYIRDWEYFFLGLQEELACAPNVDDVLKQLQPEVYSSLTDTNFDIVSAFIRNRERNSFPDRWRAKIDDSCNRCERRTICPHKSVDPGRFQFWASGFGADGKYQRRNGSSLGSASRTSYGYDTKLWGGAVGAIREWDRTYLGVTIGYATQTNKWKSLNAQTKTKAHIVEALYGRRFGRERNAFVEAYVDFAWNDQNVARNVQVGNYRSNMNAKFHDMVIGGGVRAGINTDLGCGWQFMPTVAVNVLHSRSSTISEEKTTSGATGSATALIIDKNSIDRTVVRVPIMAKVSKVFRVNECGLEVVPEVHAGVIANVGDTHGGKVRAKFAGNPVDNRWFTSNSEGKGDWEGVFGGSVEIGRRDRYYLSGSYDYTTSSNSKEHSFSVATGVNF